MFQVILPYFMVEKILLVLECFWSTCNISIVVHSCLPYIIYKHCWFNLRLTPVSGGSNTPKFQAQNMSPSSAFCSHARQFKHIKWLHLHHLGSEPCLWRQSRSQKRWCIWTTQCHCQPIKIILDFITLAASWHILFNVMVSYSVKQNGKTRLEDFSATGCNE